VTADLIGDALEVTWLGPNVCAVPRDVFCRGVAQDVGNLPLADAGFEGFHRERMPGGVRAYPLGDAAGHGIASEQIRKATLPQAFPRLAVKIGPVAGLPRRRYMNWSRRRSVSSRGMSRARPVLRMVLLAVWRMRPCAQSSWSVGRVLERAK
jgi:hypothetical protein